ncbi:MAG: protein kinase [Polyangiaceae bacterium]|nr:protein kinase [Polyangiaceae bacterium]
MSDPTPSIDPIDLPSARPTRRTIPSSLSKRYEDIEFIGEGGMGTVYRAVDPKLGRTVALKLLKAADAEMRDRFVGEARSQARIQHEHICRIYEAGEVDGEPYISMQFIDGEPLSVVRNRLTVEQCVHVMKEVALAVHEAHRIGIIHRDIKPANILVEEREDGTKKPWVMDFGLAREVDAKGQTQTGAVVGTVAYMPPEQARGDVRAMDRRSDVYALGATLYDVIAGRPPFVAEHPWKLLMMVGYDDAPTITKVQKDVPEDLETIIMKCLEREPSRRYDSARALAEDLQRFLDGEPILGKRASVGYVLFKKARKNKLLTTLLVVLTASSLTFTGVWVRAQRQAAVRETFARELGESVKEMELFLRAAYELPMHDVERERDVVRGRLREIEERMSLAGDVGEGPGYYAIGRGHLALGDPDSAQKHLRLAIAAGYSTPDVEYALGRAYGELFHRALAETKRIANEEERKKKVAELETSLRDPALLHLRAARGARLESPLYAEGLVALYEGKNEEAIEKARAAFEKAPWMYEPKKLEADALFAEGSKYRHDAAFDYDKMKKYFDPAAEAYKLAGEMGSSDPEVHRAECELWEKMAFAELSQGGPPWKAIDFANAACTRAVQSSSRDGRAILQRALALAVRSHAFGRNDKGEASTAAIKEAVEAAESALRANPGHVMALYAHAAVLLERARLALGRGEEAPIDDVIREYQGVLEKDPQFTWAHHELGEAFMHAAQLDRRRGKDMRDPIKRALEEFGRAEAQDPNFSLAIFASIDALTKLVDNALDIGKAADEHVKNLLEALKRIERRKTSDPWRTAYWSARAYRTIGMHELYLDRDPSSFIQSALDAIRKFAGDAPKDAFFLTEIARCHWARATHALHQNLDATAHIDEARRAALAVVAARGSMTLATQILLARIELESLWSTLPLKLKSGARHEAVLQYVRPLVDAKSEESAPYEIMAEVYALRAATENDPEHNIAIGLRMTSEALAKSPDLAQIFAIKGLLHLARAHRAKTSTAAAEASARATTAFEDAARRNPIMSAQYAYRRKALQRELR